MTPDYRFVPFEYREGRSKWKFWGKLPPLRFGWRIVHRNAEIITSTTSQGYSRDVDRDESCWNFYDKGILQGSILPPDWAKRP